MTVLSKPSILKALEAQRLIIDPFNSANLNSNSYDVTLGLHYGRMVGPAFRPVPAGDKTPELAIAKPAEWVNPFSKDHWDQMWETFEAIEVDYLQNDLTYKYEDFSGLTAADKVIMIEPGETILIHTEEFIGSLCDNITTYLNTNKLLSRTFVGTEQSSGWAGVGSFDRWVLPITNHNIRQRVLIKVGMKIAQIVFVEVSEPVVEKRMAPARVLENIKKRWDSTNMLPTLWRG